MAEQNQQHDDADEVTRRNVEGMRELLAQKAQQQQAHEAEPPLADDPHIGSQENLLAQEAEGSRGSTGGIRNMGGGRS
ncbi:MAG TPA: hypothetical protein VIL85_13870 [Thermomicrobiales bacterium]|jgi:hypothetical protein